jgi:Uncharacterized conserved protein
MSKKRKDWRLYLLDMLECIKRIENYVEGLSYEQFLMDDKTKDWEGWNFRPFFHNLMPFPFQACPKGVAKVQDLSPLA